LSTLLAAPLGASCGSSSCPLDTRALNLPDRGGVTLDLSFQYIDQDQPRIGTRNARVGEIPGEHHDEVRTLNRIATALVSYAPTDRLQLSAAVPFVSRDHRHLASSHEHLGNVRTDDNTVPEAWQFNGLGDVLLEGRFRVTPHVWAIGGVKLPTGSHEERNDDGEVAELPIQPGTGSTDGIVGFSFQGGTVQPIAASGPAGHYGRVPYFASVTYQFRTGATDGYRLGNELQLNAGGAYPLPHRLDLLLQLNGRRRDRDEIAAEPDEEGFTGGTYVYASPGLRWSLADRAAVYGIVQLPLYQKVEGLQLTADRNYVIGLQTRF
jgi:hypothetical protein